MVCFRGYPFQPHFITTKDGYILALHRIPYSRAEHQAAGGHRAPRGSLRTPARPVVLIWHGFLMCSEVWVCTPDPTCSLAFTLADAGYDVWLGNTRGNKYSCKHRKFKPSDYEFWDFSMDQLALFDMPDSVDYILSVTGAPSLTYIGFSQGTAQGFSGLSLSQSLNKKVNLFIALAPATKPKGLENRVINSLVHASPEVIYLLFGHKAMLSSALFWQSILSPATFAWILDLAMWFLFGWTSEFMDYKNIVYRHLYSYSSVKIVVHWFQIMKTGNFQMYDDNPPVLPTAADSHYGHHIPRYPTTGIQTPVAIFYGGRDTLPDMDYILGQCSQIISLLKIDEYEHLQFLWGRGTDQVLFPGILGLLAEHSEVWTDAHTNGSNDDVSPTEQLVRTTDWITQDQISRYIYLGKYQTRDKRTGEVTSYGSSISVKAALEEAQKLEEANYSRKRTSSPAVNKTMWADALPLDDEN